MTLQTILPADSLFARLMAEEGLTIMTSASPVAMFVPETRTVYIPEVALQTWTSDMWHLVLAHEVGHAKFTPADALTCEAYEHLQRTYQSRTPLRIMHWVNVFEDIRIERLMKEHYPGLRRLWGSGYAGLVQKNYFGPADTLATRYAQSLTLLDRVNLYSKVGTVLRLPLRDPEVYARAMATATYADVLALVASVLDSLEVLETTDPLPSVTIPDEDTSPEDASPIPGEVLETTDPIPSSPTPDEDTSSEDASGMFPEDASPIPGEKDPGEGEHAGDQETPDLETANEGHPVDDVPSSGASEGTMPQQEPDGVTVEAMSTFWEKACREAEESKTHNVVLAQTWDGVRAWEEYTRDAMATLTSEDQARWSRIERLSARHADPTLQRMAHDFYRHQQAWVLDHTETRQTGTLDPVRMCQYPITDRIFLQRTDSPTGQSHGFVVLIDVSISMHSSTSRWVSRRALAPVLLQTLHLIWFAERMGIPLEVYAMHSPRHVGVLYQSHQSEAHRALARMYLTLSLWKYLDAAFHATYSNESTDVKEFLCRQLRAYAPVCSQAFAEFPDMLEHIQTLSWKNILPLIDQTPLCANLLLLVNPVRAFRERYRIEHCVTVCLTDGEDTRGLTDLFLTHTIDKTHRAPRNAVWIDPTYQQVYVPTTASGSLSQAVACLKARTGTRVVMVYVGDSTDLNGSFLSDADMDRYETKSPRSRAAHFVGVQSPTKKKTRPTMATLNKVLASSLHTGGRSKNTRDMVTLTRATFPSLAVDSLIVTTVSWWTTSRPLRETWGGTPIVHRHAESDAMNEFTRLLVPELAMDTNLSA